MPKITLIGVEERTNPKKDERGNRIDGEYNRTVILHYTQRLTRDGTCGTAAGNVMVFDKDVSTLPRLVLGEPYLLDLSEQNYRTYFKELEPLFDAEEPFTADLSAPGEPVNPT